MKRPFDPVKTHGLRYCQLLLASLEGIGGTDSLLPQELDLVRRLAADRLREAVAAAKEEKK